MKLISMNLNIPEHNLEMGKLKMHYTPGARRLTEVLA